MRKEIWAAKHEQVEVLDEDSDTAQMLLTTIRDAEVNSSTLVNPCDRLCALLLNEASYNAALRLGFSYEGTFRQAVVYKGRNRDTAWYSVIDKEWPSLHAAFEAWLAPENFDANGMQRNSLSAIRDGG